jgi:hypothetical protein
VYRIIKLSIAFLSICSLAYSQITFQRGVRRVIPACGSEGVTSIVKSHDNGYILAGTLLQGMNDDYLSWAKADSAGNFLWFNNAGPTSYIGKKSISLTSDNGFILCGQGYDGNDRYPLIIKTDSNGVILWHQMLQGYLEPNAFSIIECYEGGYILTGEVNGHNVLLAKLSSNGTLLWSKFFGGIFSDESGYSIIQDSDSGFVICGATYGCFQPAALLMKVDSVGNFIWAKNYTGINLMYATTLNKTTDGGFIFSGYDLYAGNDHSFLIKTDSIGDTLWTRQFITSDPLTIKSIEQTHDNGYILSGSLGPQFPSKAILVKSDSTGNMLWTRAYNTNLVSQSGIGAYETSDGGYIIGCEGSFYLIKTDSIGMSCGSYTPIIHMIPGNQISIYSQAITDSSNVLNPFSTFFFNATCDTFEIDDCLTMSFQEDKNVELNISTSPNPADDFINIVSDDEIFSAEVFNSMGQKIISIKIDSKKFQLDVASYQPGVYLIKCLTKTGYSSQLFLKR